MRGILYPSGVWTAKRFSTFMLGTGAITATSFLFLAVLLFPIILVVPLLWNGLLACSLHRSRARRSLLTPLLFLLVLGSVLASLGKESVRGLRACLHWERGV